MFALGSCLICFSPRVPPHGALQQSFLLVLKDVLLYTDGGEELLYEPQNR